ncbi:unnamed protein product [Didymodactylos carnosus]|uniref:Helix-turn-helix domain-containing protein n=1 Tax=Didymodactylos carnosus TaxID=1234261 RepID=A0A814P5B4_9BILA|nr:unnamed protein product [Didymodactylos carnosus]CAF3867872.1 unnamed protein product [Didymodactylos carnosus]
MDAPNAPLMAELFMTDFEEKNPASIRQNGVRFWCHYVDDTFALLEKHVDPYIIAVLLSSFHLSLAFMFESEDENNIIPFLDVQITRSSPGFSTKVYRKPTFTSLLTRWDSYVPDIYKRNAIGTMVYRATRICSSCKLLDEEFEKIREIAGHNGYPNRYVDKIICEKLNQYYTPKVREPHCIKRTRGIEGTILCRKLVPILQQFPFEFNAAIEFDPIVHELDPIGQLHVSYCEDMWNDSNVEKLFTDTNYVGLIALFTYGNGNCIYNAIGLLASQPRAFAIELRVRNIIELTLNAASYMQEYSWYKGNLYQYVLHYLTNDKSYAEP